MSLEFVVSVYSRTILLCLLLVLAGCAGQEFRLQNFAKTDIDMVADQHQRAVEELLKELTVKLYKRNPRYLKLMPGSTIEKRTSQIFNAPGQLQFSEVGVSGTDAIELALNGSYTGDRVFALMVGLTDMIRRSYGYQSEFFMFTELDEQQLYLSARNLEIALWRLYSHRDERGNPLILTNSRNGERHNLSYERLFGKLIALQDMLGTIVAGKNQRVIKTVAQNVATMAFFPL